jgi:hypothetical protein
MVIEGCAGDLPLGAPDKSSPAIAAAVLPLVHEDRRNRSDRRRRHRVKLPLLARLRPFDPRYGQLEEVQSTLDFTREGLYFTTWLEHYCLGMFVLVVFPDSSAASVRLECLGKIVRLERLADGRLGIAVQFLF